MNEKAYQVEIEKLENAVKTLLYIVTEYSICGDVTSWAHKQDFSEDLAKVRLTLQQTNTFKSSWRKND